MVTPTNVSFGAPNGSPVVGGRFRGGGLTGFSFLDAAQPAGVFSINNIALSGNLTHDSVAPTGGLIGVYTPAWLVGKALNTWFLIPGSQPSGSQYDPVNIRNHDFSGMGVVESNSELIVAAAGGHGGSIDNSVQSIVLSADNPTWVQRNAATPVGQCVDDVGYNSDGKPASRHTYWTTHHIPQANRLMLLGCSGPHGAGTHPDTVDGFDLGSNTWDAAGTWPGMQIAACVERATGVAWGFTQPGGINRRDPVTGAVTVTMSASITGTDNFAPIMHDPVRNHLFSLRSPANGTLNSWRITSNGSVKTDITFNNSTAYTDLLTLRTPYPALEYDIANDRYLFYDGTFHPDKVFVVTPNASTVWDINYLTFGGGSVTPPTGVNGVQNKFRYIPQFKGVALLADGIQGVYFMRVA
jgi:hypothetical protein